MTIRRVTVLAALLTSGALAISAQSVDWSGAPNPSSALPSPMGCTLPSGNSSNITCIPSTSVYSVQMVVITPPAGTMDMPSWAVATGGLPPGMSINPTTGVLSGTPTSGGEYTFSISATYADVNTIDLSPVYTVADQTATLAVTQNPLPSGATAGATLPALWYTAAATGGYPFINSGTPSYNWSFAAGSNPDGLSINQTTGVISGTPTSPGNYTIILGAIDALGQGAIYRTSLAVGGTSNFSITTTSLPSVGTGQAYNQLLQESGGPATGVTWSVTTGTLPPGLAITSNSNSTGTISGTPTTAATYNFTVQASYLSGSTTITATQPLQIIVSLTSTLTLPTPTTVSGSVGQTVSMQFTATGGTPAYAYTLLSGNLPPGLSLNTGTGLITGTATQANVYTFTIQVTDSLSHTASAQATITINGQLTMPNPTSVTGTVGGAVSMQFTASNGVPPYTYSVQSGSGTLPPGVTLNSQTGLVSGTATTVGTYTFTILATDSSSRQVTATGTITIASSLTLASPAAVTGNVGATVSMTFSATGGTAPYTYAFAAGSLPPGLTLNPSTGVISGQATQSCTCAFLIQVTDSSSPALTATATGSITVSLLSISGVTINPSGTVVANTQPTVTIVLATPPPETITGTLAVVFRRVDGQGSLEVQLANQNVNGQVPFTIAAGTTTATFSGGSENLIVGTAQGTGTFTVQFLDALGNNITSATVQQVNFSIGATAPVITTFTISPPSGSTYTATIIGYSSTLDMSQAVFNFTPTSGTNLSSSSVTVSLSTVFANWYGSSQSNRYGGQFMLTVPFTFSVSGGTSSNPIDAATVTLTNSKGSTTSGSANP